MQPTPLIAGMPMFDAVLCDIAHRAPLADQGKATLAPDLADLHHAGLLAAVVTETGVGGNTRRGADVLRRIGRASLPVGRIVEGHANALRLIALYGSPAQRLDADRAAAKGAVYGVWGAEGKTPVTLTSKTAVAVELQGWKHFCSGLGLLAFAVLPVQTAQGPLLVLADVADAGRADAAIWQVSGMRATASGRYDFTGQSAQILGQPGDYLREPHFEGGIWRYLALHCGGLEALADAVRSHILQRGQADDPHQGARLAQLVIHVRTAQLWLHAASCAVESGPDIAGAVAQALLARQAAEHACLAGIALTERAMGTSAFQSTQDADRIRRDLGFFLRQANLDGKLTAATRHILTTATPVGDIW